MYPSNDPPDQVPDTHIRDHIGFRFIQLNGAANADIGKE